MAGEIRAREARLEAWNHGLEKIVEQRTAELAHAVETAQQARERAEAANRELHDELAEAARCSVRSILPNPTDHPFGVDWLYRPLDTSSAATPSATTGSTPTTSPSTCSTSAGTASAPRCSRCPRSTSSRSDSLPAPISATPRGAPRAQRLFPMEQHDDMYFTLWYGVYRGVDADAVLRERRSPAGAAADRRSERRNHRSMRLHSSAWRWARWRKLPTAARNARSPGARLLVPCDGCYEIRRPDGTVASFEDLEAFLEARSRRPTRCASSPMGAGRARRRRPRRRLLDRSRRVLKPRGHSPDQNRGLRTLVAITAVRVVARRPRWRGSPAGRCRDRRSIVGTGERATSGIPTPARSRHRARS